MGATGHNMQNFEIIIIIVDDKAVLAEIGQVRGDCRCRRSP